MSDVARMTQLMEHAADRLAEEERSVRSAFFHQNERAANATERANAMSAQASCFAAMTYAQTMLRMVAACMTLEDDDA